MVSNPRQALQHGLAILLWSAPPIFQERCSHLHHCLRHPVYHLPSHPILHILDRKTSLKLFMNFNKKKDWRNWWSSWTNKYFRWESFTGKYESLKLLENNQWNMFWVPLCSATDPSVHRASLQQTGIWVHSHLLEQQTWMKWSRVHMWA